MKARFWLASTLILFGLLLQPLFAEEFHYLSAGQLDPVAILPPPPTSGSAEQAADLATVKSEEHFDAFVFAPAIGPFFQHGKLPLTEALLHDVHGDTEQIVQHAKSFWNRTRPYVVDPSLAAHVKPEPNASYPSGHSANATVYALLLAELFPDKQPEILALGRNVGWHRVELAKHYPSDVYAGEVLAMDIVHTLKTSPKFQKDFAAAKAEAT